MSGPDPAVAAVRLATRRVLAGLEPGDLVLAACSGGADSLSLALALAFEGPKLALRTGAVVVDHGLQPGSAQRSADLAGMLRGQGLDPVEVVRVEVGTEGGPEAAARTARYHAIDEVAGRTGAVAVLLGHTRDDQAETVLLGLARGSGARSLSGMAERSGHLVRPLLGLERAVTRSACTALGVDPWEDPHNHDPAYARARVRHEAVPALERALGPGVAAALARTAGLLRADADALDGWADQVLAELGGTRNDGPASLDVAALADLPHAVRTRVLRRAAVAAGAPPGSLSAVHVAALDTLVTRWRGQGAVDLPGGVVAHRACDRLCLEPRGGA